MVDQLRYSGHRLQFNGHRRLIHKWHVAFDCWEFGVEPNVPIWRIDKVIQRSTAFVRHVYTVVGPDLYVANDKPLPSPKALLDIKAKPTRVDSLGKPVKLGDTITYLDRGKPRLWQLYRIDDESDRWVPYGPPHQSFPRAELAVTSMLQQSLHVC